MADKLILRSWFRTALIYFLIAGSIGAILRLAFILEIPGIDFRYFMNGHSHVAMLGWIYLGFFTLLLVQYKREQVNQFTNLFKATQIAVLGMLICFPIFGNNWISILFSTVHIVCSYVFTWRFLKGKSPKFKSEIIPFNFIQAGFYFMILSTFALWTLGLIMALDLSHKPVYYMMVQAFLHFQFNGWFVFIALGLLLQFLMDRGISLPKRKLKLFFWFLFISCFLTYALAITWANPKDFLFQINSIGAGLQFIAVLIFISMLWSSRKMILVEVGVGWPSRFFRLALLCFVAKILIQSAVIIPFLATVAYTVRNFVIGFIHLILLGFITSFLLAFAERHGILKMEHSQSKVGAALLFFGFLLSEFFLFGQGLLFWAALGFFPFYYEILFGVSLLMPIGVFLLLTKKGQKSNF